MYCRRSLLLGPLALLALAGSVHCGSSSSSHSYNTTPQEDAGTPPDDAATSDQDAPDSVIFAPDAGDAAEAAAEGGDSGPVGCGNGSIDDGEACDDGNSEAGDGCSSDCKTVEKDFTCQYPGTKCVSTVKCGDSIVSGNENCDDGNTKNNDGCSSQCVLENGWICPTVGKPCSPAECGDGIVVGNEECDDHNSEGDDGCSESCKVEFGWACPTAGELCHPTTCNDGTKEGTEPCDDGNQVVGDGCNPFCEVEPNCAAGACTSACGDGLILPGDNEECDDGNTKNGDGCSSDCQVEQGFQCDNVSTPLPTTLEVPITFRDFIAFTAGGSTKHPDFESFDGNVETTGLVDTELSSDGKPVYTGICELNQTTATCPEGQQTTSQANFYQWYHDVTGVNRTYVTKLSLGQQGAGYYYADSTFFPWDGMGWVGQGLESSSSGHNFGFTSELRYWFEYKGGEQLNFAGDDDVWVFINHQLAVDIGGLHPSVSKGITLDSAAASTFGLELGKIYETALFHAERHSPGSNFNLTLTGFVSAKSTCHPKCGDGFVAGDEVCDDGVNNGGWGSCTSDCKGRGPYCGDHQVQQPEEQCDDGTNLTTYGQGGVPGCAPGCVWSSYCGDSKIDSLFGEQCDDGTNQGGYGKCKSDCRLDARCGGREPSDGIRRRVR